MTEGIVFITVEGALFFHSREIERAGGAGGVRDVESLEAALATPRATFAGSYLMNFFEMAASYVESMCFRHPFVDGNKRTATACALTFLYLNGFQVTETYDEELADRVLDLVTHKIGRADLATYFETHSTKIS